MAKPAHHSYQLLLLLLILILSVHLSSQLQFSQFQTLVKVEQLLNYPSVLRRLKNTTDLCNTEPTPSLTLVCYEGNLTQLHIAGNNGVPPLPGNFSSENFFVTLGGLSSLKVLSLVSLDLWGQLPGSIGQLSSLEILNLSVNCFSGTIPGQVSSLRNLQTLILDHNNFTGRFPDWLSSHQVLSVLSLKNNSLSGFLPSSLSALQSLRVLSLSANHLSGEIPDLRNLTNLQVLDLQDNYFGPHFPSSHKKLITLVLRNNRFQFGIPAELGSYHQLQKLDISLNGFVGPFLPSLLSLPSITYLDIHGNKLTGMLLQNLSCNPELAYADLSSNLLIGHLPSCLELNAKSTIIFYSKNCLSNDEQVQHPTNFCHNEALAVNVLPQKQKNKNPNAKSVFASSTVGGTLGGIALVGVVILIIRRKVQNKNTIEIPPSRLILENVSTVNTVKLLSNAKYISRTMKLGASLPAYRTFTLEELKEATANFDASSLMGEGSHGQIYRGKLTDDTIVAIRSLKINKKYSPLMHTHHIEMISKLRHSHLVSALGHCIEFFMDDSTINTIYLVFENISNETLRSSISVFRGKKLTWIQRISTAIGVVKGVQFLHTGIVPGVFSNNLKITDVLLDQNLHVKINSYSLPLLTETTRKGSAEITSATKASILARTQQDNRSDVYDIGVILLEIIGGRPIMSHNDVVVAKDILQVSITMDHEARKSVVDPAVKKECSNESLKTMMELCLRCLSNEPTVRPSVEDVLWNLQFAMQVQNSI